MFLRFVTSVAFVAVAAKAVDCTPGDDSCNTDESAAMKMSLLQKKDIKAHAAESEVDALEARKAAIIAELGDLEIQIGTIHAEERAVLLQAKANSTENLAGSCTKADEKAMAAKGNGHADGSFPKITSNCGKDSYSVIWGFDQGHFANCAQKDVPGMGPGCAKCMAVHANYMVDNCKWACLTNWCSSSCLDCGKPHHDELQACAGDVELPTTGPC
jgi:hypothetical protein